MATLTYAKCVELMSPKRYSGLNSPRKLAHNTYLHRDTNYGEDVFEVRLHGNLIINLFKNGSVCYFARSWRTVTTKDRFNTFGPMPVRSVKGTWYAGKEPFRDGIEVGAPTFATTRDALTHAANMGDKVARAALHDMREESLLACG